MTNELKLAIAIASGFALIGIETVRTVRTEKALKEARAITRAIDGMSDTIDCDIPAAVVEMAMEKAAEKQARNLASSVSSNANSIIKASVTEAVNAEKKHITESVKAEIERQLTTVDISEMKKSVVTEAGKALVREFTTGFGLSGGLPEVIKACKEAGMNQWQIEEVVKGYKF